MKILSWNVNGLVACIKKGFFENIRDLRVDVICLQETKLSKEIEIDLPFYKYWNFADKNGYSGTAVFSRYAPLSVKHGMGSADYDNEGRIITLEYKSFYLVNVYVPNPQARLERSFYRSDFDVQFKDFIQELQSKKPVVICGDFNVAYQEIDIYPEHDEKDAMTIGFTSQERDNFKNLLDLGFLDIYRENYPDRSTYSWWSNRGNKRFEDKGLRIDYFLISEKLKKFISHIKYVTRCYGSDHCPMVLDINNKFLEIDNISDSELTEMWDNFDWESAEKDLLDMQQKLTKAAFTSNYERMLVLQKRIVCSLNAKALAVRFATDNNPTAGIDNVVWISSSDKMKGALSLTSKDYKAQPCRNLVVKNKHNGRERQISVPTIYDRCMQVLYGYSLNPIAEANGERKSFAFRKGRSLQDVHSYIMKILNGANCPEYILLADVKSYYNTLSHKWLIENIPVDKHVLKEFLSAGFIFAGELFPTEVGISLGSSISPILANMALDGMQDYIFKKVYGKYEPDYENGNLIRFADDILVTAKSYEFATKFKTIIEEFLEPRGLKLSAEKTRIVDVKEGFEFLSRHYIKRNGVIVATPSKQAVNRFANEMKDYINDFTGSQQSLILGINKKLQGFATYHRVTDCTEAFHYIDIAINAYLLELCQKKHPRTNQKTLIQKYWYKDANGEFIYALPNKIECQVIKLSNISCVNHLKIRTSANPYLEKDYFEEREGQRDLHNLNGKYKSIYDRQDGKCFYCGQPILTDQDKKIIQINIMKGKSISNLALVHSFCLQNNYEKTSTRDEISTHGDLLGVLEKLHSNQKDKVNFRPYELLNNYFFNLEESTHSLTFEQIEKIMKTPLCQSAYKYKSYWQGKQEGLIAKCWIDNGYIIQNIHLDKKYIVFRKDDSNISKLNIPAVFLTKKIPLNAKYEIENYLEHIKRKYGL